MPSLGQPTAGGNTHAGRTFAQVVKDIVLFFAAPFITLAYMPLFPFIAVAMLIKVEAQARHQRKEAGRRTR